MKGIDAVKDTYKETRTFQFDNMIVRVHLPELTPEERSRRMQTIHKAAENLLKGCAKK